MGVSSGIATVKAFAPQEPWCVLGWWLQQGVREDMAWSKPIDCYVLSCGPLAIYPGLWREDELKQEEIYLSGVRAKCLGEAESPLDLW